MPGERPVTWFELVTLFAFLCFRNAGMDYGVFEVGLGGRLDATNIIIPEICCVNVIELEHTEYLGDTLEKIAMEKAGIIKAGIPVLVANQLSDSVNEVFKKVCKEKNAPLFFVKDLINSLEYSYSELGLMKIHI